MMYLDFILFIGVFILIIILGKIAYSSNNRDHRIGLLSTLTVVLFVANNFVIMIYNYERGQIDALTGNIKYEIVTHSDSTRTWEEIKP